MTEEFGVNLPPEEIRRLAEIEEKKAEKKWRAAGQLDAWEECKKAKQRMLAWWPFIRRMTKEEIEAMP